MNQNNHDVVLAVLPWAPIHTPSIQLGLLKAVLDLERIPSVVSHLNVAFYKFLKSLPDALSSITSAQSHDQLKDLSPLSSWLFATGPLFDQTTTWDALVKLMKKKLTHGESGQLDQLLQLREQIPRFLTQCADHMLSRNPKVVGFSCTFDQRTPSLVLAKMLKLENPALKIVFGGTYMDGIMGQAFIEAFPWVDAVVRGDGERVTPPLFRHLLSDAPASHLKLPGLCLRNGDVLLIEPESAANRTDPRQLPTPNYDDYFADIQDTDLDNPDFIRIPIETSRGCWWYKYKCKFCGRSQDNLAYHIKTPAQIADELRTLSGTYHQTDFMIVDPAVLPEAAAKVMKGLKEENLDFSYWCQSRVKFKPHTLHTMARAGLNTIFMGIESLSTPVLDLMRKGHTAMDAIEALKICREQGITVTWNLIYNFPGETAAHYQEMAALMAALIHLPPPFHLIPMALCRAAVYFDEAERYGIQLLDPDPMEDPVYVLARSIAENFPIRNLASKLEARYQRTDPAAVQLCREVLERWKRDYPVNGGQLFYRRGAGFLTIYDQRNTQPREVYTLGEHESKLYLACVSPRSLEEVYDGLDEAAKKELSKEDVKEFLDLICANGLAYSEKGRYLALAIKRTAE